MLFDRAYTICTTHHLKKEPDHLRYVCQKHDNYTKWIIELVAKQVKDQNIQNNADEVSTVVNGLLSNSKSYTPPLFHTGQKGEHSIRSLQKDIHHMLPKNAQTRICYTGTKLGTKFNSIKGPVKKSHQQNGVCYAACPKPGCV